MENLNFKVWLEENFSKKPNSFNQYQVRDLRTAPYGPFTGFRDTPNIGTRFGSDILHGMQNFYSNVRNDSTLQAVRPTYDISRDFKIDSSGKYAIVEIPYEKSYFYKKDKDGNFLDVNNNITTKENGIFENPKVIEKRANEVLQNYLAKNPEIIKKLMKKDAHIESLAYVDADEIKEKNNGEPMILLKFAAKIWNPNDRTKVKVGTPNPNHKFNVVINKENI